MERDDVKNLIQEHEKFEKLKRGKICLYLKNLEYEYKQFSFLLHELQIFETAERRCTPFSIAKNSASRGRR